MSTQRSVYPIICCQISQCKRERVQADKATGTGNTSGMRSSSMITRENRINRHRTPGKDAPTAYPHIAVTAIASREVRYHDQFQANFVDSPISAFFGKKKRVSKPSMPVSNTIPLR